MTGQTAAKLKVALIGTHGVGKTTLVYGLASRLKRRDVDLEVLVEVARRCPLPLNEETNLAAQTWILHTQIADETWAQARSPVVLCDRSVLDNYTYLLLAAGSQPHLEPLLQARLATYDLLVHVPIVEGASVMGDGVRSTDEGFRRTVQDRLDLEIERRGLDVLRLDPRHRDGWLDVLEDACCRELRQPQLELLS